MLTDDKPDTLNWPNILDDLLEGQAVLLLGHDFLPNVYAGLNNVFKEKVSEGLLYTYQRDGLFLFANNDAKVAAQREAARYYRSIVPDEEILRRIVQLPFRLIVTANPDNSLVDAFARWRLPFQTDYYSSEPKESETQLSRPSSDKPLIYKICGSIDDRKSLILDYDDLFKLLANMLANTNVPISEVRRPLKDATTFIFYGFRLERWYTQLFLRYLNQNEHHYTNNARNYALQTKIDDDTRSFIMSQFNVRHIGADASFLNELYQRFAEKYPERLRKLTEVQSQTGATVIQLIEKNDIASAVAMLKIFEAQLDGDSQALFMMTQSTYSQYLKEQDEPVSTQEQLNILLNRVRQNLRLLAQKLP
ncbi:MAG TPA: SIR2 family protein [Saprospiraceae bacterium]|nr:SIR2 family protein [Saprospiraceae bacterium]